MRVRIYYDIHCIVFQISCDKNGGDYVGSYEILTIFVTQFVRCIIKTHTHIIYRIY